MKVSCAGERFFPKYRYTFWHLLMQSHDGEERILTDLPED